MRRSVKSLWRNDSGAVAPTVALSLVALIAAGGLAFDYARMAALDTELQQAADQAALAAATQLDGEADAATRATAAASSIDFVSNDALFARDATASRRVTIASLTFYQTKADAEADTNGFAGTATNGADAHFVKVTVGVRRANFALTPIVAAFSSGDLGAEAVAGLGTAICKVPPVMMCNPAEPDGNANKNLAFDANGRKGMGLRLVSVGNGNTAWAPGNFGYLDTGSSTSNPNVELRQALGWLTAPGDCSALDGVKTRTGAGTPVTQAINTRFDIYQKPDVGNGNSSSCPGGGSCPASINSVKDVIYRGSPNNANKCSFANNEWELPPTANRYLPTSTADLTQAEADNVKAMGYPRDKCHAISQNGSCTNGKIGDGAWDRNAYFRVNYGWTSSEWPTHVSTGVASARITTSTPSRHQVYLWEIANRGSTIGGKVILNPRQYGTGTNGETDHDAPVCSPLQGYGSGVVPGGSNPDRRRISAAVINCNAWGVHGGGGTVYGVAKWVELFLVEPSLQRDRTDANDVYVEIIGETSLDAAGASAGQVTRRDVPYLIK